MSKFNIKNSVIGAFGKNAKSNNNIFNSMCNGISMSSNGNHTTLVINGRKYEIEGNVSIMGKDIYVNGELYNLDDPDLKAATNQTVINITVEGNVEDVRCSGSVHVGGSVARSVNTTGSVTVKENVNGNIRTMGHVDVGGQCSGHISTMGNVTVRKQ